MLFSISIFPCCLFFGETKTNGLNGDEELLKPKRTEKKFKADLKILFTPINGVTVIQISCMLSNIATLNNIKTSKCCYNCHAKHLIPLNLDLCSCI